MIAREGALFKRDNVPVNARTLMEEFCQIVTDRRFPCFFARNAFLDDDLLFGMADISHGMESLRLLFDSSVGAIGEKPDQTIVIWVTGFSSVSLDDDYRVTSKILKYLLENDEVAWPRGVPIDPVSPEWDFWYGGIDFFVNVSTANHLLRHSRNLGSAYSLVAQPWSSFNFVDEQWLDACRTIRKLVGRYDSIPFSPALGVHGESVEIDQFFLWDDNSHEGNYDLFSCVNGDDFTEPEKERP